MVMSLDGLAGRQLKFTMQIDTYGAYSVPAKDTDVMTGKHPTFWGGRGEIRTNMAIY